MGSFLRLSPTVLAHMRLQVNSLLPDTATIQQATRSADGAGGYSESWTTLATVPCRLDTIPRPSYATTVAEEQALELLRVLTVPWNAALTVDHRVVVGSDTYELRSLEEDQSWKTCIRARVAKIK